MDPNAKILGRVSGLRSHAQSDSTALHYPFPLPGSRTTRPPSFLCHSLAVSTLDLRQLRAESRNPRGAHAHGPTQRKRPGRRSRPLQERTQEAPEAAAFRGQKGRAEGGREGAEAAGGGAAPQGMGAEARRRGVGGRAGEADRVEAGDEEGADGEAVGGEGDENRAAAEGGRGWAEGGGGSRVRSSHDPQRNPQPRATGALLIHFLSSI